MSVLTREGFHALQAQAADALARSKSALTVLICAGTGCIASGSMKVYENLRNECQERGLSIYVGLTHHGEEEKSLHIKMSGCHGFCEMGCLVHIEPLGVMYVRVKPEDCHEIVERTLLGGEIIERLTYHQNGVSYPRQEDIPFYKKQHRVVLKGCGASDAEDLEEYIAKDGYRAFEKALFDMTDEAICREISDSGLRGRGGGGFPAGLRDQRAAERQILPDVHGDIPQLPAALCGDLRGSAGIFRRKRRRAAAPPGADEKDVLPRRGGHGCFCRAVRAENELRSVYAVLPCRGKAFPLPKDDRIGAFVQRRRAFGPAARRERAKPRAVQERAAAALLSLSQQREIIDKRPAGCRVLQQIPAAEDERAGALHSSAYRRNVQIIQTVNIKPARRFLWPVREHRDRAFRRGGAPIAQKIFEHQLIAAVAAAVGSGDHELPPGRENSAADLFFAQRHGGEGKLLCRPVTERCAELFAQRRTGEGRDIKYEVQDERRDQQPGEIRVLGGGAL